MCLRQKNHHSIQTPDQCAQRCNNLLSPEGGDSDHQRQQREWGERDPAGFGLRSSMAIVLIPLGAVSFSHTRGFGRDGGGVARGLVIRRGVRPIAWPIIIVPLTSVSAPRSTAFLICNVEDSDRQRFMCVISSPINEWCFK